MTRKVLETIFIIYLRDCLPPITPDNVVILSFKKSFDWKLYNFNQKQKCDTFERL